MDKTPIIYNIHLAYSGLASCTCPDFLRNGGPCKHLRSALSMLDGHRTVHHKNIPPLTLPGSERDARKLLTNLTVQTLDISQPKSSESSALVTVIRTPIATAVCRLEQVLDEDGIAWAGDAEDIG
jgi:hypothetical protein